MGLGLGFGRIFTKDPCGLKVEVLPELLSEGLVLTIPARSQQGEKAAIWLVGRFNGSMLS